MKNKIMLLSALILVLAASTINLSTFYNAQVFAATNASSGRTSGSEEQGWKTSYIVGKFGRFDKVISSDPLMPDQIFKVYYRVINGTVDNFSAISPLQIVADVSSKSNNINNNGSSLLEIKFPRNYPYSNNVKSSVNDFAFFIQHPNEHEESFIANSSATDCFYDFSIQFTDNAKIKIIGIQLPENNTTFHGDTVPSSCIADTVVSNVTTMKDGTISPLQQYKAGVAVKDVVCNDGLELVIQPITGKPYCAKHDTIIKLNHWWHIENPGG